MRRKQRRTRLWLLLSGSIVLSGCGGGGRGNGGGAIASATSLLVNVLTNRNTYRSGDRVLVALVAQNNSEAPVVVSFGGETVPIIAIVNGENAVVHQDRFRCPPDVSCIERFPLGPGEAVAVDFEWNQVDRRSSQNVAPGRYEVQGFMTQVNGVDETVASNVFVIEITS